MFKWTKRFAGWKRWGVIFLAIHVILFLISILIPVCVGYFYREESPFLFLIYTLPLFFDFPVSFILAQTSMQEYLLLIMLFLIGSFYWFLIGSLLGLVFVRLSGRESTQ